MPIVYFPGQLPFPIWFDTSAAVPYVGTFNATPIQGSEAREVIFDLIDDPTFSVTIQPRTGSQRFLDQLERETLEKKACLERKIKEFGETLIEVRGVKCVMIAEASEGRAFDVTAFVHPLTDECEEALYHLEFEAIRNTPDLLLDLHVRDTADVKGSSIPLTFGENCLAVWGNLDAERT